MLEYQNLARKFLGWTCLYGSCAVILPSLLCVEDISGHREAQLDAPKCQGSGFLALCRPLISLGLIQPV
jgi:hypothetical protein